MMLATLWSAGWRTDLPARVISEEDETERIPLVKTMGCSPYTIGFPDTGRMPNPRQVANVRERLKVPLSVSGDKYN